MKRLLLAAAPIAALLAPEPATACMGDSLTRALIHNAPPAPLPTGAVIAEVRFESTDLRHLQGEGVRAEVRRMIQGDYAGRTLIVRQVNPTSCSDPFENGVEGLIVAIPLGTVNGELVVNPIDAAEIDGFRLSDGFQLTALSERWMARHRRTAFEISQRTSR